MFWPVLISAGLEVLLLCFGNIGKVAGLIAGWGARERGRQEKIGDPIIRDMKITIYEVHTCLRQILFK